MNKIKIHNEVIIKETGDHAFIVWFSESPDEDSYLLEIKGKNEMPKFYSRNDFITLEEKILVLISKKIIITR